MRRSRYVFQLRSGTPRSISARMYDSLLSGYKDGTSRRHNKNSIMRNNTGLIIQYDRTAEQYEISLSEQNSYDKRSIFYGMDYTFDWDIWAMEIPIVSLLYSGPWERLADRDRWVWYANLHSFLEAQWAVPVKIKALKERQARKEDAQLIKKRSPTFPNEPNEPKEKNKLNGEHDPPGWRVTLHSPWLRATFYRFYRLYLSIHRVQRNELTERGVTIKA